MGAEVIATCTNPHREGSYASLDPGENAAPCHEMECGCTRRVYVAVDALLSDEAVEAAARAWLRTMSRPSPRAPRPAEAALRAAVEAITTTTEEA